MKVIINAFATAVILCANPAFSSYYLHESTLNDIIMKKKLGDWNPTSDFRTLKEIQEGIKKKQTRFTQKRYCAGLPSINQPMLLNVCDEIGLTKAEQAFISESIPELEWEEVAELVKAE